MSKEFKKSLKVLFETTREQSKKFKMIFDELKRLMEKYIIPNILNEKEYIPSSY